MFKSIHPTSLGGGSEDDLVYKRQYSFLLPFLSFMPMPMGIDAFLTNMYSFSLLPIPTGRFPPLPSFPYVLYIYGYMPRYHIQPPARPHNNQLPTNMARANTPSCEPMMPGGEDIEPPFATAGARDCPTKLGPH